MEILLNRWRGTGDIFNIWKLRITGTMIYALYIGLLFGVLTQNIFIAVLTLIGFLAGESFGWGKWVGALCYPETKTDLQLQYDDLEGYSFPFIHYIANFIVKEKENFFQYCRVALGLRGFIWAMLIYITLMLFGYISILEYIMICIIWGIGFPFACYISALKEFNFKNIFVSIIGKWETQEIYYGMIHFLCNIYIIITII